MHLGDTGSGLAARSARISAPSRAFTPSRFHIQAAVSARASRRRSSRRNAGEAGPSGPIKGAESRCPPALPGAVAVSTAGAHTCAALLGGSVACWGDNSMGQLGVGQNVPLSATPLVVTFGPGK
jgi:hypothetical protein